MKNATTMSRQRGSPERRSRRQRIGDRLFAQDDAFARAHGWRTTELYGGLGREYRSSYFDRFSRCSTCLGAGVSSTRPVRCGRCAGTGRVDRCNQARVG